MAPQNQGNQGNVLKDATWYLGTRLALAAAAGAATAAFLVEPVADAVHEFHGGTSDMVACQSHLQPNKTTNFPSENVPDGCNYWKGTVVLTHIGEDYKMVPTEVGKAPKKEVTQKADEFYTYPKISEFNSQNKDGAQAADAARDALVTRIQHDTGTGVAIATLVGAVGVTLLRRRRTNRPPEMPKTRSSGGGRPRHEADMPTTSIPFRAGE